MNDRKEKLIKAINRFVLGTLIFSISFVFFTISMMSFVLYNQHIVVMHELSGFGLIAGILLQYRERHWIFKDPLTQFNKQVDDFYKKLEDIN